MSPAAWGYQNLPNMNLNSFEYTFLRIWLLGAPPRSEIDWQTHKENNSAKYDVNFVDSQILALVRERVVHTNKIWHPLNLACQ